MAGRLVVWCKRQGGEEGDLGIPFICDYLQNYYGKFCHCIDRTCIIISARIECCDFLDWLDYSTDLVSFSLFSFNLSKKR